MARATDLSISIVAALMALAILTLTQACKPEKNESEITLEYKMMKSDILIYGYPRKRVKDVRFPSNQQVFVVDFEVRCIFKGGRLGENIKIHGVGQQDPMCHKIEMLKDKPLLVYLNRKGGRLVPTYKEDPGQEQFLEEIPIICGATVSYPIGYSERTYRERCPEAWEFSEDECVPLPTEEPALTAEHEGNKKSEDMIQAVQQAPTTPANRAVAYKHSLVTSLSVAFFAGLCTLSRF